MRLRPRRQRKQPRAMSTMTAAPPTAIPAIARVERIGEELEDAELVVLAEMELEVEVGTDVVMTRVGVRTALLAVRVKYTGRSRFSQVAGAVTVAAPTELKIINKLDASTALKLKQRNNDRADVD
jgi:hypothetical protein